MKWLFFLSVLRGIREHWLIWGFFFIVYSFSASWLVQPLAEQAVGIWKVEAPLILVWLGLSMTILSPLALAPFGRLPPLIRGALSLKKKSVHIGTLYLRSELRNSGMLLATVLLFILGATLPLKFAAVWILIVQIPVQRAAFRVGQWGRFCRQSFGPRGTLQLLDAIVVTSVVAGLTASIGIIYRDPLQAPAIIGAVFSAALGGGAVLLEADSGRPWLVNWVVMAAGVLASSLAWWHVGWTVVPLYFYFQMRPAVQKRLWSIEHEERDTLLS